MRQILASAAAIALPGVAMAHTALGEHAHPHAAGHPYLGIDVVLIVAAVAIAGGVVAYAYRRGLRSGR
ncbi:MAG: hypothetical protein RLT05_17380 [Bauldia litoralis]